MPSKLIANLIAAGNMASTVSAVQSIANYLNYSVYAAWTGTPTGTIKLQASNTNNGTDWQDIAGSSVSIAGSAGDNFWNITGACYSFFQVVYTPASGSGTLNANAFLKNTVV